MPRKKRAKPAGKKLNGFLCLGFTSYGEYLASELWARILRLVMERECGRCECCDSHAEQVHHFSYSEDVMIGENLNPLVALCRPCHEQAELRRSGKKNSHAVANWSIYSRLVNSSSADRIALAMGYNPIKRTRSQGKKKRSAKVGRPLTRQQKREMRSQEKASREFRVYQSWVTAGNTDTLEASGPQRLGSGGQDPFLQFRAPTESEK